MEQINFSAQFPRVIVSIIVGSFFILFPSFFENFVMYIVGGVIAILGGVELVAYFMSKKTTADRPLPIVAIIAVIIGVIILIKVEVFTTIMMFSLGFILLAIGLGQIVVYLEMKKRLAVPSKLYIAPAIITLSGILAIINPFGTIRSLVVFFGVVVLFSAISQLISMMVIKRMK